MREPIEFHRMLLNADERMQTYRQAIQAAVRPGDVVLDVGTGSGILAFFACQAGAKQVYAVERSDAIILAQKLAQANGFGDRITFLRQDIFELVLPELVDVITSELVSKAVIGQRMAETIGYCRERFLKAGGRIVPEQVALLVAPVEAPKLYQRYAFPAPTAYALDFQPAAAWAYNQTTSVNMPAEALLAAGQVAYHYAAETAPLEDRIRAQLTFTLAKAATLHGFCAWFSARLVTDRAGQPIVLSNQPPGIGAWDNLFFPLPQPLELTAGSQIELRLDGNDTRQIPLFWAWRTCIRVTEQTAAAGSSGAEQIYSFTQSTLQGQLLSAAGWKKRHDTFVPTLREAGRIDAFILNQMQEGHSLAEISDALCQRFPRRYSQPREALTYVADLSERYSE